MRLFRIQIIILVFTCLLAGCTAKDDGPVVITKDKSKFTPSLSPATGIEEGEEQAHPAASQTPEGGSSDNQELELTEPDWNVSHAYYYSLIKDENENESLQLIRWDEDIFRYNSDGSYTKTMTRYNAKDGEIIMDDNLILFRTISEYDCNGFLNTCTEYDWFTHNENNSFSHVFLLSFKWIYERDDKGNIIKSYRYEHEEQTLDYWNEYIYDENGSIKEEWKIYPGEKPTYPPTKTKEYFYDESGKQLIKETENKYNGSYVYDTLYDYDDAGRIVRKRLFENTNFLMEESRYEYNEDGNIKSIVNENSNGDSTTQRFGQKGANHFYEIKDNYADYITFYSEYKENGTSVYDVSYYRNGNVAYENIYDKWGKMIFNYEYNEAGKMIGKTEYTYEKE